MSNFLVIHGKWACSAPVNSTWLKVEVDLSEFWDQAVEPELAKETEEQPDKKVETWDLCYENQEKKAF